LLGLFGQQCSGGLCDAGAEFESLYGCAGMVTPPQPMTVMGYEGGGGGSREGRGGDLRS